PPPLPAPLATATHRIKQAVKAAAERTVESLGLSAMASANVHQRDAMLGAQFELNRKLATFVQAFSDAFDNQLRKERRGGPAAPGEAADWDHLSLVEDRELEIKVQAERFGLEITHACEWELRELESYVGSLLGQARAERDQNPLRPEVVGHGVIRAVDAVADRPEIRRVLERELNRSLTAVLRTTYADIVSEMRKSGIQPVSLTVRTTEDRGDPSRLGAADPGGTGRGVDSTRSVQGALRDGSPSAQAPLGPRSQTGSLGARTRSGDAGSDPSGRRAGSRGTPIGHIDAGMMDLLRRLTQVEPAGGDGGGGAASHWGADSADGVFSSAAGAVTNLIHANREELQRASRGAIDHMVIDVIGNLFDQILSDPKVPPQLARQIARLQLPVLRAALGDSSFFSSRKHPVRQFINRVASLGNGFDDFNTPQAQTFLTKVRDLVQEIVKGDFDQIETYEARLATLEAFAADQARAAVESQQAGAVQLLQEREDALRLDRQYAQQLEAELQPLAVPAFVRDFVARVWSRVILKAAHREGVTSDRVRQLRSAGRELFMSVQPKTSLAQRKVFLAELPKLMQQINEGLNSIGWPDDRRRAFFGQLMPAHAEALKAQTGRVLDFNMLGRQVEQVLERDLPTRADLPPASSAEPVLPDDPAAPAFTRDEALQLGLIDEASIDWNGKVDIDLGAEPEVTTVDLELPGLPASAEPIEPASGRSLAEHVQIGFSYQMHLEGSWQKVRLAVISPGRSFFVFTRGNRHQRTISLTHRMLVRMCETGRMRAFEGAQLLERATARTRRQLATISASASR
ncbi:MAG: hypothetical protein RJA10_3398, partial [Pseudomonadota bacterium]